jgi:hypothetical protein
MASFKENVKDSLKEMIPKEHDDYEEIRFNDYIYLHVWSHDDGEGKFEMEIIIPHKGNYSGYEDGDVLDDVNGIDTFLSEINNAMKELGIEESLEPIQFMEHVKEGEAGSIQRIVPSHDVYCSSTMETDSI